MRRLFGSLLLTVGMSFAHFLVVKPDSDIVRKPVIKVESELRVIPLCTTKSRGAGYS